MRYGVVDWNVLCCLNVNEWDDVISLSSICGSVHERVAIYDCELLCFQHIPTHCCYVLVAAEHVVERRYSNELAITSVKNT